MAENLLAEGAAYVFEAAGPAVIDLALEGGAALSQVSLLSAPGPGEAVPRRVLVQVNASESGGSWRTFWSGDMPPDGQLETPQRLATTARRLRVTISSAWSEGPVRLDAIRAR